MPSLVWVCWGNLQPYAQGIGRKCHRHRCKEPPVKLAQEHFAVWRLPATHRASRIKLQNTPTAWEPMQLSLQPPPPAPTPLTLRCHCRKRQSGYFERCAHRFRARPALVQKELQLLMSCSYGPGRYDLNYEERNDYQLLMYAGPKTQHGSLAATSGKRFYQPGLPHYPWLLEDAPKPTT